MDNQKFLRLVNILKNVSSPSGTMNSKEREEYLHTLRELTHEVQNTPSMADQDTDASGQEQSSDPL